MNYTLTRSNRRTCAIYIRTGAVEVRAPLTLSQAAIDRIVNRKADWIARKLAESRTQTDQRSSFVLHYGDNVLYRGREYPITAKPGNQAGFDGASFWMPPDLPPERIKAICALTYRLCAKQTLPKKAADFARRMDVMPASVRINGAKTRWGSCSTKKNVSFSWYLMMADDEIIDYVVIHELAHLTEMNHSPRFWAIVAGVLPDYKARQARLKLLQQRLRTENWDR
jgi:predicted metal-dependent hydrolase